MTSLMLEDNILIFKTSSEDFSYVLLDDLKASIPIHGRNWNRKRKVWEIAYNHGQDVIDVVRRNLGKTLTLPQQITDSMPKTEIRLLKLEYIGAAKERNDGSIIALGFCDNQWSIVFSLKVLREWFEGNGDTPLNPNSAPSLYAVLGVNKKATDRDIKKAFRIAAKTWHPDINDDKDAATQFRRVNDAYETLKNDKLRRKYDAINWMLAQNKNTENAELIQSSVWRPPKRCGWITVEGQETLGRFIVSHILQWNEIVEAGMYMVSYWPKDGDKFAIDWI